MELDTEFSYPNVIDLFGTTLFHLCHFAEVDLQSYKAYDKYAEANLVKSNELLCDEVNQIIDNAEDSDHADILDSYGQVFAFIRRYENAHGRYEVPLPPGASRLRFD